MPWRLIRPKVACNNIDSNYIIYQKEFAICLMLSLELKKLEGMDLLDKGCISTVYNFLISLDIAKNKAAVTTKLRPYYIYEDWELLFIMLREENVGILGLKAEKDLVTIDFIGISQESQRKGIARMIIKALPVKYNVERINIVPKKETEPVFEKLGFITNNVRRRIGTKLYSYMVNNQL